MERVNDGDRLSLSVLRLASKRAGKTNGIWSSIARAAAAARGAQFCEASKKAQKPFNLLPDDPQSNGRLTE